MANSASGQDESNPALWLATRAGRMEPSCPLGTTRLVPQEKIPQMPYNKSFIDQACSVKMAWYWPRSFFACLWTSTPSRSINTQKKNSANIQPSWPHTWSITHTYCVTLCCHCSCQQLILILIGSYVYLGLALKGKCNLAKKALLCKRCYAQHLYLVIGFII